MSANAWIILGVLSLAFSAFAIPYGFYLRGESTKTSSVKPSVSVVSHAQKGGITANSVSIDNITVVRNGTLPEPTSKNETQTKSFVLADCTMDAAFEFPPGSLQKFRHAFPGETGTLSVILEIFQSGTPEQGARLQLTGDWRGTSGMVPRYSEDSIIFTLSEQRFTLWHKKPIVEHVPNTMGRLVTGRKYSIQITAFPGFAIPLIPKQLTVRTHEGVLYPIRDFKGPDKGWYSATFSP